MGKAASLSNRRSHERLRPGAPPSRWQRLWSGASASPSAYRGACVDNPSSAFGSGAFGFFASRVTTSEGGFSRRSQGSINAHDIMTWEEQLAGHSLDLPSALYDEPSVRGHTRNGGAAGQTGMQESSSAVFAQRSDSLLNHQSDRDEPVNSADLKGHKAPMVAVDMDPSNALGSGSADTPRALANAPEAQRWQPAEVLQAYVRAQVGAYVMGGLQA